MKQTAFGHGKSLLDPGMFAKMSPIGVNFAWSMGLDKTKLQPNLETRGQTFP